MCTATVALADAVPGQPVMVSGDSTVERSGICTSLLLLAAQPVGLADGVGVGLGDGVSVGGGLDVGVGLGVGVGFTVAKFAVTCRTWSIITRQTPVPEQSPDQPVNTDESSGVAVRVTSVPASKFPAQA